MRSHIQGLFLLLIVGIVLLGTARIAAPIVKEAFGDDGAIVAESSEIEDTVDLSTAQVEFDAPLSSEEVYEIQWQLTELGFDAGPADGIMGPTTRSAIDAAAASFELGPDVSDRAVLVYVGSLLDALDAAAVADAEVTDGTVGEETDVTG